MIEEFIDKFKSEALEYISVLEANMLLLEENPKDTVLVEEAFRVMHNLKGNSAMFGFFNIDNIAHLLESLFDKVRKDKITIDSYFVTTILEIGDFLRLLINNNDEISQDSKLKKNRIIDKIEELISSENQMIFSKDTNLPINYKNDNDRRSKETVESHINSIRVASSKLDELINIVSEQVIVQERLKMLSKKIFDEELSRITYDIDKLTNKLRNVAFALILIPIKSLFPRYQRMVRDLAKELGKDIIFDVSENNTELDKYVVECLSDPLMHLIRNSLDHAIEKASERVLKNKSEKGKIIIKSYYSGAYVVIEVSDDGRGIDVNKVKEKAIRDGLINKDDNISDKQIINYIFSPGFSTASKVSDISGRGVGLDVVFKNILNLRGTISVDTSKDKGTTFTIKLPVTLSIFDGLLIETNGNKYIVPLFSVKRILPMKYIDIISETTNSIIINENRIPFVNLIEVFGGKRNNNTNIASMLIVEIEGIEFGIVIDEVLGEYQTVLKSINSLANVRDIFLGASFLGDGKIVLVLDINNLVKARFGLEIFAN